MNHRFPTSPVDNSTDLLNSPVLFHWPASLLAAETCGNVQVSFARLAAFVGSIAKTAIRLGVNSICPLVNIPMRMLPRFATGHWITRWAWRDP